MRTVLLIDADLMAYRAAAANQRDYNWGDGVESRVVDLEEAKQGLRDQIAGWVRELDADDVLICLSDDFVNWRKDVYPEYKGSRKEVERPEVLYVLKDWLTENYPWKRINTLEADDLLGIYSTEPHEGERRIMVTQDKDMRTIPGYLYRPFDERPEVIHITPEDAARYHLYQTIIGDTTDGYPGCPGAGPAAADALLDTNMGWESYEHVFKSGPRKGLTETRWKAKQFDNPWDAIVSLYEKKGLTEADALAQARVARILHASEFDGRRPILWRPSK